MAEAEIRSVLWASKQYGVHPKRLAKLMAQKHYLIEGGDRVARFKMSAEAAGFLEKLSGAMSLGEAATYINAPRPHDRLLLEAGILVPFVRGGVDGIKDHAFAKVDLDALLASLLNGALEGKVDGMENLLGAAKKANCSAVEIVHLLLDGQLQQRRRDPSASWFMSLLVDPGEVLELVRLPDHGGLSLRAVEKELGTNTAVVSALIESGHLASDRRVNSIKRQPQTVVYPAVLAAFKQTYVSLHDLAISGHHNPGALRRDLDAAGILPALPGLPASFYLRAQVEPQAVPTPEP